MTKTARKRTTNRHASRIEEFKQALERLGHTNPAPWIGEVQPLLQIPDCLLGLLPISDNVQAILPHLEQLEVNTTDLETLRAWTGTILCIPGDDPLWASNKYLTRAIYENGTARSPLHGYYSNHPIWVGLWYVYHDFDAPQSRVYGWLRAQFLAAHLRLLRGLGNQSGKDRRYEASRVLRYAHDKETFRLIDRVDAAVDDPYALAKTLQSFKSEETQHTSKPHFLVYPAANLGQLVADAHDLDLDLFRESKGSAPKGKRGPASHRTEQRMDPGHSGFWYYQQGFLHGVSSWGNDTFCVDSQSIAGSLGDEIEAAGITAAEYETPQTAGARTRDLLGLEDDEKDFEPADLPPLPSLYARARSTARRIAMDAQRLRVEPRRIRIAQLGAMLRTFEQIFLESADPKRDDEPLRERKERALRQETALVGAISLVTGTSPETVRRICLIDSISDLPHHYELAYNREHRMWIRPYSPPERHPLSESNRAHVHKTSPRVVFEDVLGVGRHLNGYVDRSNRKQPFASKPKTYRKRWDKHFKPALVAAGIEPHWARLDALSQALPSWFEWQEEGDHLASAMLFGINDPRAHTQRFYTSWHRAKLANVYQRRLCSLLEELAMATTPPSEEPSLFDYQAPRAKIPTSWVGNDRMPSLPSLQKLIAANRDQLHYPGPNDAEGWFAYHNAMTLYAALGLVIATGARSIRTPFPDLRAIHKPTGTVALQEKDRADSSHARMVALPEVVVEQVDIYLDHLIELFTAFPALPVTLRCEVTKHRDRAAYNDAHIDLDLRRTFFFIDSATPNQPATWEPTELTGRQIYTHSNGVCPNHWPIENAGRHLLRSHLTAEGCDPTLINAHLGHWHYGEEPWAGPSAMDPVAYRYAIRPYLDGIMATLDYRACRP